MKSFSLLPDQLKSMVLKDLSVIVRGSLQVKLEISSPKNQEHMAPHTITIQTIQLSLALRSIGDYDTTELSRLFGGGGHKNASGFLLKKPVTEESGITLWSDVAHAASY
jgi:nanoRNase/pAp phosphatase (c-di-AMP/oligoRNAs hydrolase)